MIPARTHCKKKCIIFNENHEGQNENHETEPTLLPGLPNYVAHLCLSKLQQQPSLLYAVCRSWRRMIYSPYFPPFLSLYALLFNLSSNSIAFSCFDPLSSQWRPLPDPPSNPPLCLLRRHPSFVSRIYPIQSIAASGRLVVIAGNANKYLPALTRPLMFDPSSGCWSFGPPFSSPRRWCVTGVMNGTIYVASGTSEQYNIDVARSLERWDVSKKEDEWNWEKKQPLKHGRFAREAVEAVGLRGKLLMVNVKGKSAKEGAVYDVVKDQWEEMPKGMVVGWNGPATGDADGLYVLDQEKGLIKKYDEGKACWERLSEPLEELKGAEQLSASRGKFCVVSGDGRKIVVVDILARPVKVWVMDPPEGMEAVAVHVLPRMSH